MVFDPTTAQPVSGFDPTTARPATLNPNLAAQGAKAESAQEVLRSGAEFMSSRDPGIDYKTGIPSAGFRAGLSRMTNDAEKEKFLNLNVGQGKWGRDSFGAYFVKPEGLARFGIKSDRPVSIDEQVASRYDIADIAGDLPAIAGATAFGMAATGAGAIPGMAMAGLGAAGGKAIDELVKGFQGSQVKTPKEVATTLAGEGVSGAFGEGLGRSIASVGKFVLGPAASRMTPAKKELAESALEQGFKVRPGAVTDAPILARWEGMVRNIFGDLHAEKNKRAAEAGFARLSGQSSVSKQEAGDVVSTSIKAARVKFGNDMASKYQAVDDLAGNAPIIPTAPLKKQAEALIEAMPKTEAGKVVQGVDAGLLQDILKMGDATTVAQAQRLRTLLREAADSPNLVPGVAQHEARVLKKSVDEAFEQAANSPDPAMSAAAKALREADAAYKIGIRQFDNPVVTAITKDASRTGAVDADMVVDYLVKPERVLRLRQIKQLVPAEQWAKVQTAHAQDLLSTVIQGTDDPLTSVFNGRALRDTLDKYGRTVLNEVHGRQWVDSAYKYANALMLAEKKMTLSGGIVAANIALHPVQNFPSLVWLRGLAKVMENPKAFKYLTEGVQLGASTKAGAAAINRVLNQALVNARDETGSAKVTLTEPE